MSEEYTLYECFRIIALDVHIKGLEGSVIRYPRIPVIDDTERDIVIKILIDQGFVEELNRTGVSYWYNLTDLGVDAFLQYISYLNI